MAPQMLYESYKGGTYGTTKDNSKSIHAFKWETDFKENL
jgi:hypothetical protein